MSKTQNLTRITVTLEGDDSQVLRTLTETINDKKLGKRVSSRSIVVEALKLLSGDEKTIKRIQENSFTSDEKIGLQYQEYLKTNPDTSLELFKELLLAAALSGKRLK